MIFHLKSTDANNYGTIKFSANPPLGKEPLLFRINQINTVSAFLVTTKDDYLEITKGGQNNKYYFTNKGDYDRTALYQQIQKVIPEVITVYLNEMNTLTFSSNYDFTINDASHRVKLLTGLYNTTFPISATKSIDNQYFITANSVPYNCFGNCLYLASNVSSVAGFNDDKNKDVYRSVCYNISEMFIPGVPLISKIPGPKTRILPGDLTKLEFTLVDFQNYPVILKAPLHITMEIMYDNQIIENVIVPEKESRAPGVRESCLGTPSLIDKNRLLVNA